MLIGKYVFVIFLSIFYHKKFQGHWLRKLRLRPHQDFKIWHFPNNFCKKGCFLSYEWWKCHFATFGCPWKIFWPTPWKIHYWPLPGKNPSGAHVYGYTLIYRNAKGVHRGGKFGNRWLWRWHGPRTKYNVIGELPLHTKRLQTNSAIYIEPLYKGFQAQFGLN